jgi:hypothetical protein
MSCRAAEPRHDRKVSVLSIVGVRERERCCDHSSVQYVAGRRELDYDIGRRGKVRHGGHEILLLGVVLCCSDGRWGVASGECSVEVRFWAGEDGWMG